MKTLFYTAILGLFVNLSATAKPIGTNYYVSVTGQLTDCKRIAFRANEIKVVLENGENVLVPMAQIKTIKAKGKVYDKLPVYRNNQPTNKEAFMELITTKEGLKLYKYLTDISSDKREKGFNVNDGYQMENYVVYKDGQYKEEINDLNYAAIFAYFKINYREK